ncbi:recombinase family protein [Labedella phragmitis]|uniref:recombinase family protein n=1 Tax=Labedella phragmitis TaxID=2498849 RepID=UPI0024373A60|nr:recombinase family protein [Labedella phragmitis]
MPPRPHGAGCCGERVRHAPRPRRCGNPERERSAWRQRIGVRVPSSGALHICPQGTDAPQPDTVRSAYARDAATTIRGGSLAVIGYARAVGSVTSLDEQVARLEEAGVDRVFVDRLRAGREGYPALGECIGNLGIGDILTVTAIERLPRGIPALVEVMRRVRARGAHFRELSGRYDTTTTGGAAFFRWIEQIGERLE